MFCLTIPIDPEDPDLQPFRLLREHLLPALEAHRPELEAMYAPNIGRPQTDPVRLIEPDERLGGTVLDRFLILQPNTRRIRNEVFLACNR